MDSQNIELAKKRIWKRLEGRLPDRGLSVFQHVIFTLRNPQVPVSRLRKVQLKERLLDLLPSPAPAFSFLSQRFFASAFLLILFAFIFAPQVHLSPSVMAASINTLEVVQGIAFINGESVSGTVMVQEGDRIQTREGTLAHLLFLDDSRVTLSPQSEVDIVDTEVDPYNRAETRVEIVQRSGRIWVQVLNLISTDSYFKLSFPNGEILVRNRASFDAQVDGDETQIAVARSLVDVSVNRNDVSYAGILGQGARLFVLENIETEEISSEQEEQDVWWAFNLAYGKSYAHILDENYKKETALHASILPGNPLYFLKTFRENVQVSLAFTSAAKEHLLVEQAETRLNEAQILLAQGDTETAQEVLQVYKETVENSLENSDNEELLATLEETQKEVLTAQEVDEGVTMLEDHLQTSSAAMTSDFTDKAELKMSSASQKLQRLPDLIANGDYEEALNVLSLYQQESLSLVSELEELPMEEREQVISSLLEQKIKDIQLLRVVASMSELTEVDLSGSLVEQLSMMVLSLREKELTDLSAFFEATNHDVDLQYDVYARLRGQTPITDELSQQFEDVEEKLSEVGSEAVVIDIEEVVDPRFQE